MPKGLPTGGSDKSQKGVKAQKAKIAAGWDKMDKRDGFALDRARIEKEEDELDNYGYSYSHQVGKGLYGRWAPNTPYDEERRLTARALQGGKSSAKYKGANIDLSLDKIVEWEKEDDDKALQQRANYLLQQTLSSKDPFQRALAFERFPILDKVPQQYFETIVQDQMRLYYLLQQGEIKNEDDNLFVLKICHINYRIPLEPIWDPFSKITTLPWAASQNGARNEAGRKHGLFHPRTLGILADNVASVGGTAAEAEALKKQIQIKVYVLKELYPNIREGTPAYATEVIANILTGFSPLLDASQSWQNDQVKKGMKWFADKDSQNNAKIGDTTAEQYYSEAEFRDISRMKTIIAEAFNE